MTKKNNGQKKGKKSGARQKANPGFNPPRTLVRQVNNAPLMKMTKRIHHKAACSILDPFCVHAKGAARPDGLGTQALPYQVKFLLNPQVKATFDYMIQFVPGAGLFGYAIANDVAGVWNIPAAWTACPGGASTFLTANAAEVRLVSFGVRATVVSPATTCSGYVTFGTIPNPIVAGAYSKGNITYPEVTTKSIAPGTELMWYSKPTGADAHKFIPVAQLTTTMTDFNWTALSVEVTGSATANDKPLMFEVIMNVEFTFKTSSSVVDGSAGLAMFVKPAATPSNPVATTVQNAVHTAMPSFIEGTVGSASAKIEKFASDALDAALSGGWAALGALF
jgi:hypothetical protein